jgi:hypothetical protein
MEREDPKAPNPAATHLNLCAILSEMGRYIITFHNTQPFSIDCVFSRNLIHPHAHCTHKSYQHPSITTCLCPPLDPSIRHTSAHEQALCALSLLLSEIKASQDDPRAYVDPRIDACL